MCIRPLTCASPSPSSIVSNDICSILVFSSTRFVSPFSRLIVFIEDRRLLSIWLCSFFNVSSPWMTVLVFVMMSSCDRAVIFPISSIFFLKLHKYRSSIWGFCSFFCPIYSSWRFFWGVPTNCSFTI